MCNSISIKGSDLVKEGEVMISTLTKYRKTIIATCIHCEATKHRLFRDVWSYSHAKKYVNGLSHYPLSKCYQRLRHLDRRLGDLGRMVRRGKIHPECMIHLKNREVSILDSCKDLLNELDNDIIREVIGKWD